MLVLKAESGVGCSHESVWAQTGRLFSGGISRI